MASNMFTSCRPTTVTPVTDGVVCYKCAEFTCGRSTCTSATTSPSIEFVLPLPGLLPRSGLRTREQSNMQFTAGPPPYDSEHRDYRRRRMLQVRRSSVTTSWMRLYMHLRHRCLTEDECLLLPGSYLVQEARREEREALAQTRVSEM